MQWKMKKPDRGLCLPLPAVYIKLGETILLPCGMDIFFTIKRSCGHERTFDFSNIHLGADTYFIFGANLLLGDTTTVPEATSAASSPVLFIHNGPCIGHSCG
jgi:hypothetical protein